MSIPPDIPAWADVKIYNNAGLYTWTKPPWAKMVYYNIMHAGNGGGGGFSRTSGQGGGGAGGGEGNGLYGVNPAALFPNTLVIRVGKGGTGGAAGTAGSAAQSTTANWKDMRLWDGQIGGVGNPGTVSAGGSPSTSNSSNNSSRVGNFGISISNGTQAFGQSGSASGSTTLDVSTPNQVQHGGAGGAGVSSTGFAGRGGGYQGQVSQSADISENNLTTRFVRGGHGASVILKGHGISNNTTSEYNTTTVTYETGETVIVGLHVILSNGSNTYSGTVTDGTNTYEAITAFAPNVTGGQGGIILFKADNVVGGTYTLTSAVISNGTPIGSSATTWYRYDGLSSGPVLASAVSSQNGTGVTTNGITCGPLSSTAVPCLLFAATTGQNNAEYQQRVEPGTSINKFIEPTNRSNAGYRISAGDSLITTTASVTAQFTVFDNFTYRTTAAVLIGVKTNQLEPKAGNGMDGDIYWLPNTIIPFIRGGGGGGSSHFTEGGDGGRGGPCSSGGGGGAGNPGGRGGDGGDGMCIIACW